MNVTSASRLIGRSVHDNQGNGVGEVTHLTARLPQALEARSDWLSAAEAIMTTDTVPKAFSNRLRLSAGEAAITGIAKGAGMIKPNMATMLSFVASDINIDVRLLDKALKYCVERSFNMITVDGDTSTNDMVAILANGMAGNDKVMDEEDPLYRKFRTKLLELLIHLAKLIVSDGEGASKFVEYKVSKAKSEVIARKLIRAISDSVLVKTAMFGRDPNWGRIIAACGNAGIAFSYKKANLYLGDSENLVLVLQKGTPTEFDKNYMKKLLRESHIRVYLELNTGKEEAVGWGSDLTTDYVMFNSVYTT
jgi:glutamate N-acetyltransferase / amino-acid N-acetyltransferase